jgi:parallel beta-helix repeat protein
LKFKEKFMSKITWRLLLACVVMVSSVFSLPAFAVDGQVLINQATVMAAGGFPYIISAPGSYKLSGNLSVASAGVDGIDIKADNVVLDLNGFTISGTGILASLTGIGIFTTAHKNITVKNGSVVGFENTGVQLTGGGGIVEDVHASEPNSGLTGFGIIVSGGIVRHCTAVGSDTGIAVQSGVVEGNTVENNTIGISAIDSTVIGNSVTGNGLGLDGNGDLFGVTGPASLYGSNAFRNNGTDVAAFGGVLISQGNNICSTGALC